MRSVVIFLLGGDEVHVNPQWVRVSKWHEAGRLGSKIQSVEDYTSLCPIPQKLCLRDSYEPTQSLSLKKIASFILPSTSQRLQLASILQILVVSVVSFLTKAIETIQETIKNGSCETNNESQETKKFINHD